ncbi:MAG: GNAT family N-acetyltransferase [Candidatus Thorarchaeota archaeon]|nr:GNAT family N-acetyltransferase [Candidatus Thorarchaeota archaeon]
MIRTFTESDFKARQDTILSIAKAMSQDEFSPEKIFERIEAAFEEGKLEICGHYDTSGKSLLGLVFVGHVSDIISWLYIDEKALKHDEMMISEIQRSLIDEAINRLAANEHGIGAQGSYLTDKVAALLISSGFTKYDRTSMYVSRARIESIDNPLLPEGYTLEPYNPEEYKQVAQLIHGSNAGGIDVRIFPKSFGSVHGCERFLEEVRKNIYGEYHQESSTIARLDNEIVGVCFITTNANTGFIPEISVSLAHRRMGLGYALAVHSMKTLLKSKPEIEKLSLDVTLSNPALHLYERIGFEKAQGYSMYRYYPTGA